ncbi:sensor histidine kinase [Streptomyces sp. ISL-11]|uniref:sensor histidine kinase n=1 Tax=Streptomyces sp. ISL-11 TaxID=2819174 RepID=UPI001BE8B102|nr:histidine kinase [Streptomyces sp. ISL-11]MBT2382856.1 sensor histidine kinase [Streptomyces sp. ISL-11]
MKATTWARELWRRLVDPGQWSRRRLAGECALALTLAGLSGAIEWLSGNGVLRIVAVAAAVAALSLLRRVLPGTVLVVAAALSGVTEGGGLILFLAGWSAGRRIPGVMRALVTFCAAFVVNMVLGLWHIQQSVLLFASLGTLTFLVSAVVPGLTSRYWTQRRTLLQALRERNAQLLRERQMIAGQARLRERQRIAQDMHDSLGHQLALIAVHTGALEVDRELTGRQREAVGVLRDASVAAMHELREVVGILKDAGTAEEREPVSRAVAGIEALVESAAAAGARVRFERSGEPRRLALTADHAAYRVAQEGLTNAYKHAPGAPITVSLRYEPDAVVVEVANGPAPDGPGAWAAPVSGGQGLTGLRERARLVGGMVYAGPLDGGFRLAGVLPYETKEAGESTFVDAADDFRQQMGQLPPGDGGPVIDWSDPREEFENIVSKKRNGCLIGCGVALLVLVGLVVLAVLGVGKVIEESDKALIGPDDYASVRIGESEKQVRERLPSGESFITSDVKTKLPDDPEGTSCLALLSTDTSKGLSTDTVYRFCFKDGKLAEKRVFHVKN